MRPLFAQKIGEELTEMLGRELAFWKKKGPTLPAGWWNGSELNWTEVEVLRDRYGITLAVVRGLGEARSTEGRKAVKQFRDFWLSLPQLKEIGQMSEECDRVSGEPLRVTHEVGEERTLVFWGLGLLLCVASAFLLARSLRQSRTQA